MIKIFAKVDEAGNFTGFYPSDAYPTPPSGTVEITLSQHRQYFDGQAAGKNYKLFGGQLVEGSLPTPSVDESV